jgi:VCBS repeat-containing protein
VDDTGSIAAGSLGPATGNVITDAEGDGGADTKGADGARVTAIASTNVPANTDNTADGSGNFSVAGQYGVLTLHQDGSYSYARNAGSAGGVRDIFTYTLTDGDGDTDTATLTISLGDGTPTLLLPTPGSEEAIVSEAGLGPRSSEPAGTAEMSDGNPANDSSTAERVSGTISFTPGDTPAVVTIGGAPVTGLVGQVFTGSHGTLTIIAGTDLAAGTIKYTYTLTDNTVGNTTHDDFSVVVKDADNDTASGTLRIDIVDDVPHATDHNGAIRDSAGQVLSGLVHYGLGADGFGSAGGLGGVTLSLTGATSGGSPISLTSHGKAVATAAIDSNFDDLQELVGFVNNAGGTSGYDDGIDTLVFKLAPTTASAAYGTYDLTLYDVLDLQAPLQTFTVGDSIEAGAPGAGLVITNGAGAGTISVLATPEGGHKVNSNDGELGIDNTVLNTGGSYDETITLQFGTAFSGTTVTTAAVLNDVSITGFNVGGSGDSFSWVAKKGNVTVGSGNVSMSEGHGTNDPISALSAIHVDGGYDTLVLTMTGGDFKLGGFTYTQQGASIDTLLNFNYTAEDAGGDTATGAFSVTVSDTLATGLSPGAGDLATITDILTG